MTATHGATLGLLAGAVLLLGGSFYLSLRTSQTVAKSAEAIAAIEAAATSATKVEAVDSKELAANCVGENFVVSCTLTNTSKRAVSTCIRGKLSQKRASGVVLKSQVLCTGRLGPMETKTISGPWIGGAVRDICHSTDQFGHEAIDWLACDFVNENVDPSQ